MRIKLALACAVLGLTAAGTAGAQQQGTLEKIRQTGAISLGGRDASFPFSYITGSSSVPIGFSADLCAKVVDAVKTRLGMPEIRVNYVMVTPANRIPLVQNGTVDLECSTTTNTNVRAEQVEFAPTHFVSGIGVAVRKGSGIEGVASLKGRRVAAVTGSTSIQLLRAYQRNENINIDEIWGKDIADAFLLLSSGRADALVLDDVQLAGLIANSANPEQYEILGERLRSEPYGFMFRKQDPEFKAVVDETLTTLMKNGEIRDIYAKWFLSAVPPSGANLNFPMSGEVEAAYASPDNKGI